MNKRSIIWLITFLSVQSILAQKKSLPVIDMHLHASPANSQGPPPMNMGTPFRDLGIHDPKDDYRATALKASKTNAWADQFISSPTTDDSLRQMTLSILEKHNVYAVTSGDIEFVRKWKLESPRRIINGISWGFGTANRKGLKVDSLEKLFKSGEFKVFGEITIQYEGISPSDSAFEPYLAMAERLDIPVGIHIGTGPPGAPYLFFKNYRARLT